jgi:hypothetical protein
MTKVKAMPKMPKLSKMPKIKDVDHFIWFQVSCFRNQITEVREQTAEKSHSYWFQEIGGRSEN